MIVVTYGVWEIMKILRFHGTSGVHPKGGCWAAGPYPPPQLQAFKTKKTYVAERVELSGLNKVSKSWNIYLYVSKCSCKQIVCRSYIHDMIFITSVFKMKQELYIALGLPPPPNKKFWVCACGTALDDRDCN